MIKTAMAAGANNDELLEGIMRTLDQQKMISYCSKDEISILSLGSCACGNHGRQLDNTKGASCISWSN
jgi:hypothetical protein